MPHDSLLLWKALQGIICVYKPAEISVKSLRKKLITKLCKDLSELDVKLRHPNPKLTALPVSSDPHTNSIVETESSENALEDISSSAISSGISHIDLRYHPLVVGPRYLDEDLTVSWSNFLGWNTSGVLLFGLRSGTQYAKFIRENRSTRAYRVTGSFGKATDNGFKTGKVVEKSTWKYINQNHIQQILSAMQASHQKKVFEISGVDIHSQTAYELAAKGPIRPVNSEVPIIYNLKCLDYEGPGFTIEVQCINENENYLTTLIHDIGIRLHSTAHTTAIKCIRHSCFTLEHALLPKHWNLQNITKNMDMCSKLLRDNESVINQTSAVLN
ncbi:unnamed protein product [Phyllotreta striolata]|uniref:Pseudouridine synthase II N-terminal domain-containing protein n=1 Tax=Phyllotreta striolata TaxID=444603 RepID=A0A9N9XLD8_PHYSR|nr:unnamed protein product [Phyllotreta striolata]